jgi:hypothetical protein
MSGSSSSKLMPVFDPLSSFKSPNTLGFPYPNSNDLKNCMLDG